MKKVISAQMVSHGVQRAQYFQGHGIATTKWSDSATGCADTMVEAYEDALEQLAAEGWDSDAVDSYLKAHDYERKRGFAQDELRRRVHCHSVECDYWPDEHWYVSIDVKGEPGEGSP